jgi:hypothetical protein
MRKSVQALAPRLGTRIDEALELDQRATIRLHA